MAEDRAPVDQYAALAWQEIGGERRYLVVTSRRTGRWIFPKGTANGSESPGAAALREAWEEAGAAGSVGAAPVGRYRTLKVALPRPRWLTVELWPVRLSGLLDDYPEARLRRRRLVTLAEAHDLLSQDDMRCLLDRFDAALPVRSADSGEGG